MTKGADSLLAKRRKKYDLDHPVESYIKNTLMHPSKWGAGTYAGVAGATALTSLAAYYAYQRMQAEEEAKKKKKRSRVLKTKLALA
jgi:hypothetical protein